MFDNVGVVHDPGRARRQAVAAVLSALLVGGGLGFAVAAGSWTVSKLAPQLRAQEEPVLVELVQLDELEPPELPPAPPPPAGGQAGSEDLREHRVAASGAAEASVAHEEPSDAALDDAEDDVEDVEASGPAVLSAPPTLDGRAFGSRRPGKEVAPRSGTAEGDPMSRPFDGKVVHHTELKLRRKVEPVYPPALDEPANCKARIRIGRDGSPVGMVVTGCSSTFEAATRRALMQWRWAPPQFDGESLAVETVYGVKFEPER